MDPVLSSLLLNLNGLSDEDAEQKTFDEYVKLYLNKTTHKGMIGIHKTHDNEDILFYEWRFDHAFFESAYKTSRKYNKDKFDRIRAVRVRWIGKIIEGSINGCEFCDIPSPNRRDSTGKFLRQRVYILWEENYLVWLEPRNFGGWWFSSAYVESRGRRYIKSNIISRGMRKKISRD